MSICLLYEIINGFCIKNKMTGGKKEVGCIWNMDFDDWMLVMGIVVGEIRSNYQIENQMARQNCQYV